MQSKRAWFVSHPPLAHVFGLLTLFVLCTSVLVFIYRPMWEDEKYIEQRSSELIEAINSRPKNEKLVKNVEEEIDRMIEQRRQLFDAPRNIENPIELIRCFAEDAGVRLSSFRDSQSILVEDVRGLEIELVANGDYLAICKFLYSIERSARPMRIVQMSLGGNSQEKRGGCQLQMRVVVYDAALLDAPVFARDSTEFENRTLRSTPDLMSNTGHRTGDQRAKQL